MAVDDWNLDAFRELDDQPALPFDAAAPVEEPVRESRCTSCGEPADGRLCVACERAFRLAAERTVVEPPLAEPPLVEPPLVEPSFVERSHVEPSHVEPSLVEPPLVVAPTSLTVTAPPLEELFAALEKVQRDASAAIASSAPVLEPFAVEQPTVEQPAVVTESIVTEPIVTEPIVTEPIVHQSVLDQPAVVALPAATSDFDVSEFALDLDERPARPVVAPAAPVVEPEPVFAAAPVFEKAERAIAESKPEAKPDVPAVNPVIAETLKAWDVPAFEPPVLKTPVVATPVVAPPVVDNQVAKPLVAEAPVVKTPVAKPPVAEKRPVLRETAVISAPVSSSGSLRYIGVAAAIILVIGAIGIPMGRMYPRTQATTEVVQPAPAPTSAARTSAPAPAPARVEKAVAREAAPVAVAPPVVAPAPRVVETPRRNASVAVSAPPPAPVSAPVAATPERVELKPAPPPRAATQPPAFSLPPTTTAVAPGALAEAPAEPVAVKRETPAAAPEPAAAPKSAVPPSGPFYEAMDVDEPPQVAARTEPHIGEDLQAHLVKEIVIVRVLVSEAGHPVLVRLLRGSRTGRALDAAIVAAVQQWTFTPASKRGQRVTCWLNTAVTIGK